MLVASIYMHQLDEPEFIHHWLREMKEIGCDQVFTSLHIPEDRAGNMSERLERLLTEAESFQIQVVADISPSALSYLGLTLDEFTARYAQSLHSLRLDYGFSMSEVKQLSASFQLVLNASTLQKKDLQNLSSMGIPMKQMEAWHNFYPKPYTGLSFSFLQKQDELCRKFHIQTASFFPGDLEKRGPFYQGLPTIEEHRFIPPFVSMVECIEYFGHQKVLLGDLALSKESMEQISLYLNEQTFLLRYNRTTEKPSLLQHMNQLHTNRKDEADYLIRSDGSRCNGLEADNTNRNIPIMPGDILVDAKEAGRYEGELTIAKKSMPANSDASVTGRVIPEDTALLPYIAGGRKFYLKEV